MEKTQVRYTAQGDSIVKWQERPRADFRAPMPWSATCWVVANAQEQTLCLLFTIYENVCKDLIFLKHNLANVEKNLELTLYQLN